MVKISEVKDEDENSQEDNNNEESANNEQEDKDKVPEAKLLGLISYNTGILIGAALTLLGTLWVCISFEEQDRTRFLTIAAFNLSCLGVTYFSQSTLNKRR